MRALLTFLASRLTRALIAVWLVSTVVFVVMRLSGDPVPLLLPPDAPRSEYARVAKELGTDRAPHALGAARGAPAGLRAHRARQGPARVARGGQARLSQRRHSRADDHRAAARHPARPVGGHGDGLRVAGPGAARHPLDLQPRLPGRAVRGVPLRPRLRRHQLRHRDRVWLPRSPYPSPLTRRSTRRAAAAWPSAR